MDKETFVKMALQHEAKKRERKRKAKFDVQAIDSIRNTRVERIKNTYRRGAR